MRRSIYLAIVGLFVVAGALGQDVVQKNQDPICSFSEVLRSGGWIVPGLSGAKVLQQRSPLTNMPGVFLTKLEPLNSEATLTEILCANDQAGRLEIGDEPIKILHLWSFDFGGAVFAYRLEYGNERIRDGIRHELMSASVVMFYDLDGSGRFTLARRPESMGSPWFMPGFIPDWAKKQGENKPAN